MANIEFIQGNQHHSSNWGKYYVKGLENWQVKEDFPENCQDKHHSYQGFQCNDVPENVVFSIFEQSGDKRGTGSFYFSLCVTDDGSIEQDKAGYGSGKVIGNYRLICRGEGKIKAPRLMGWWVDNPTLHSLAYAEHCGAHLNKRGLKVLPPMPGQLTHVPIVEPDFKGCVDFTVGPDGEVLKGFTRFHLTPDHVRELTDWLATIVERDGVQPGDPKHSLSVLYSTLRNFL